MIWRLTWTLCPWFLPLGLEPNRPHFSLRRHRQIGRITWGTPKRDLET